jgi:hypothetical protein
VNKEQREAMNADSERASKLLDKILRGLSQINIVTEWNDVGPEIDPAKSGCAYADVTLRVGGQDIASSATLQRVEPRDSDQVWLFVLKSMGHQLYLPENPTEDDLAALRRRIADAL